MSQTEPTGEGGGGASGIDRRQAALVGLCLLGVVVAAFVAPVAPDANGPGPDGGPGSENGESGAQSGDGGGGSGAGAEGGDSGEGAGERGEGGSGGAGGGGGGAGGGGNGDGGEGGGGGGGVISEEGDPAPVPGGDAPPTERGCGVVVEDEPHPGGPVSVRVYDDLTPAEDVPVWFGDRFVGRTDATGRVTGRAPYTRELNVTVRVPGEDCEFFRRPYPGEDGGAGGDGDRASVRAASLGAGTESAVFGGGSASPRLRQDDGGNDTGTYEVRGSVEISVVGEPYPGTNVTVNAAVDGVPMRRAAVSVDAGPVGRTTANGSYDLAVPTDAETLSVTVERGDFSGSRTVEVWQLEATVVPQEGLPVPGEPAVVAATAGPEPAADARVDLDGSRLGATDENGTVAFALPADPRARLTVETDRQSATTTLLAAYAATILSSALLLVAGVVGTAVAARVRGRNAARRVATWWVGLAVLFVGLAVGEGVGLLAAAGLVAVGAAVGHRRTVAAGGRTLAERLRALAAWLRRTALALADWVAVALDRLGAVLGRLASRIAALPLSARGLVGRLWGWLRSLPGRIRTGVAARLTRRRVAAGLLAIVLVAALTHRFGALGPLGGLVGLCAAVVAYRWWTREGVGGDGATDDGRRNVAAGGSASGADGESRKRRSIRALWRRFARWVRPRRWRQSTPGEVSRAAVERGLPERPVRALTDAFREVEYGDRSPDERGERAREAFESIDREREREGEES